MVGGLGAMDPQGIVWRWDPAQGTCTPISARPGGGEARFAGAVYDAPRDRLLVLSFSGDYYRDGAFELDALSMGGGWTHLWTGPHLASPWLAGVATDTKRDQLALIGVWDPDAGRQRVLRIPLASPEAWTSEYIGGHGPPAPAVSHGCAVYEAARDRFHVVFDESRGDFPEWGGSDALSSVWRMNAGGEPSLTPFSPLPVEEWDPIRQLAYDAALDRLLLVNAHAETWAVPLGGGTTLRLDRGNGGWDRVGLATAFDPDSRRLFCHGGEVFNEVLPLFMSLETDSGAVWAPPDPPAGAAWRLERPRGLGSRSYNELVLDPLAGQIVVYGGLVRDFRGRGDRMGGLVMGHALDPSSEWVPLGTNSPSSPGLRFLPACVYDPTHHALLLYGGGALDGTGSVRGDLWSLPLDPGGVWEQIVPDGPAPPAVRAAALFRDPARQRFILMGGCGPQGGMTDAWELVLDPVPTWRRLGVSGVLGLPYPAVFTDEARGKAWTYTWCNAVSSLSLDADSVKGTAVCAAGEIPDPRLQFTSLAFDPSRGRLLMFLAPWSAADAPLDVLWTVQLDSTATWSRRQIEGVPPTRRDLLSLVFDPVHHQLLLVGGYSDNENDWGDTWRLGGGNLPPDCRNAAASVAELWPPNQQMVPVSVAGITDPDGDPVTISYDRVTQDEPVDGDGAGGACPDAQISVAGVELRAERAGQGNGRVYEIAYTASDGCGGTSRGIVRVRVPHDRRSGVACVDDGQKYNSLGVCKSGAGPVAGAEAGSGGTSDGAPATLRLSLARMGGGEALFEYALPQDADVLLAVYDIAGRRVATLEKGRQSAGLHQALWNASGVSHGVYFCRVQTGRGSVTRPVLVLRR